MKISKTLILFLFLLFSCGRNNSVLKNKQLEQLEEESIKISINNLFSFPYIKKGVNDKKLSIHGLIHDIGSGELKFLNPLTEEFEHL